MKFETITVRGGCDAKDNNSCISMPIYQTSAFEFSDVQYAADLFDLKAEGDIYTRLSNPTTTALEKRIALMEKGIGALCVSSGQSASMIAVLNIAKSGDEVVASSTLYGGTINLLSTSLKKLGINTQFVQSDDLAEYEQLITDKTKCLFVEMLGNPKLDVADLEPLAKLAHKYNIPLIVDNTVPTPYLCNPFDFGADIVVHSMTKYMSGHGNALGGAIVDSGNFDWTKSDKFPDLNEPDESYHGISYTKDFGKAAYIVKARAQLLRDFGACISPFNAYLILLGLETLHLRMDRHSENALKLAEYLYKHEKIEWVNYPMLEDNEYYPLAKKYLKQGSSLVSFGLKCEGTAIEAGTRFIENLKLLVHATNIGDAKTIVTYPALTTHRQLSTDEKKACGIEDNFIRISVGLENIDDIITDVEQALSFC